MPSKITKSYKDSLLKRLKKNDEAAAYLDAALEDGSPDVFLLALRDVVEARVGGVGPLAEKVGLNRESLYKTLSGKGNPALSSLDSILSAVGLRLSIESKKAG
jgi:probable addiction module antidote protein